MLSDLLFSDAVNLVTDATTQPESLLDLIRLKLQTRQGEILESIEAYPGAANPREAGYRHLIKQRDALQRQLDEVDAVERISGGDLSHNHQALAKFIVGLTTLSESDRMEIVQYAVDN